MLRPRLIVAASPTKYLKMAKKGAYKIPFTKNAHGDVSMMEWTAADEGVTEWAEDWHHNYLPFEWRENVPFEAELQIGGSWRGRSAARVGLTNVTNNESYSMGFVGFCEAVVKLGVKPGGRIKGKWSYRKQGANYALHLYEEDE